MNDIDQAKGKAQQLAGTVAHEIKGVAGQFEGKAQQLAGTVAQEIKGVAGQFEGKAQQLQNETAMLVQRNRTSIVAASVVGALIVISILGFLATRLRRRSESGS